MKKLLLIAFILFAGNATASSLPNCSTDFISKWDNCFGTYTYADGDIYVGEFKDGKRHGQGTYTFANGDKYVGEFKDGEEHGQGIYTFANGSKYVGEYKYGKRHRQGTYTFANGNKYVGEYKYDKKHGQGTFTWEKDSKWAGNKYVGEWKDGKIHGQGTYTFADGTVKKGVWEKGSYFGTKAEWDAKIAIEEKEEKERLAREKERLAREREAEKKYNTIYNFCLLDKSKEVDMQVNAISEAVYKTCKDIAADPTWYENFKYNK